MVYIVIGVVAFGAVICCVMYGAYSMGRYRARADAVPLTALSVPALEMVNHTHVMVTAEVVAGTAGAPLPPGSAKFSPAR